MRKLVLLAAFAAAGVAQVKEASPPRVARVFQIKDGDPQRIWQMLRNVGYNVDFDARLKVVVVTAEPSLMQNAAEIVSKLDAPMPGPRNVELTFYILEAGAQGGTVPAVLEPVTKQMREMFGYQGFRVLDSPVVRAREGHNASVSGTVMAGGKPQGYVMSLRTSAIESTRQAVVRIDEMRFSIGSGSGIPMINTSFEISAGQFAVIGKTGMEGADRALLLVATSRVIE